MERLRNFVVHGTSPLHAGYDHPVGDPLFQLAVNGPVVNGHRQPVLAMGTLVPTESVVKIVPTIPLKHYTPFAVTQDGIQNLLEHGSLNHSNGRGDGSQLKSFDSVWDQWAHTLTQHPLQFLGQLLDGLKRALGYVIWNYIDFAEQFRRWDGTLWGLVHGTQLLWRSLVTVALTVGLFELGPLLEALAVWARILMDLVRTAFQLTVEAVEMVWYVLGRVWDDLVEGAYRLTHW